MAKQKRTIPLGKFTYGEISPQAAQSLSPKESPYALRAAHNFHVDMLSGGATRRGTELLAELNIPEESGWAQDSKNVIDNVFPGCMYGAGTRLRYGKIITLSLGPGDNGTILVHILKNIGGEQVLYHTFDTKIPKEDYTRTYSDSTWFYSGRYEEIADIHNDYLVIWENGLVRLYDVSGESPVFIDSFINDTIDLRSVVLNIDEDNVYVYYDEKSFAADKTLVYCYPYGSSGFGSYFTYDFIESEYSPDNIIQTFDIAGDYAAVFYSRPHYGTYTSIYYIIVLFKKEGASFVSKFNTGIGSTIVNAKDSGYTSYGESIREWYSSISLSVNKYGDVAINFPYFKYSLIGSHIDYTQLRLYKWYNGKFEEVVFKNGGDSDTMRYEYAAVDKTEQRSAYGDENGNVYIYDTSSYPFSLSDELAVPAVARGYGNRLGIESQYVIASNTKAYDRILESGIIFVYRYGPLPNTVKLYPIVDPGSEKMNLYIGHATHLDSVYGEQTIQNKTSPPGSDCLFLDFKQSGQYMIAIDSARSNVYALDLVSNDEFVPLSTLINNVPSGANPDWGSDIPKSIAYHEGRFLFISPRRYYGSALEHKDSENGNRPFTFPAETKTVDGESVLTESTSFKYQPLGGGDPGFHWITTGRMVFGGSKKSIWILSQPNGVVSATNPNMHRISSLGTSKVKGLQTGGGLYYILADEKTVVAITVTQDGPISKPINIASNHLFKNSKPLKMTITYGLHAMLWILRDDGKVVSYTINDADQLNADGAWALNDFGGRVIDMCAFNTDTESTLAILIERIDNNGKSRRLVEKITEDNVFLDCFSLVGTADSYTNLTYANSRVFVMSDEGSDYYDIGADGVIDFGETLNNIKVGYPYDSYMSPRVYPDVHGKEKGRIISIAPIVEDTKGFDYGTDLSSLTRKTLVDYGTYTGQVENVSMVSGFEYMPGFYIKAIPGEYMEINAIYVEVE